jgi:DNA-binding CsgD family transcriptional regulator
MAKELTVREMARMGGIARAKTYSKAQLRAWSRQGGRPASLSGKALSRLKTLLAQGKSQGECAKLLGVSVRTIGRIVARIKTSDNRRQPT